MLVALMPLEAFTNRARAGPGIQAMKFIKGRMKLMNRTTFVQIFASVVAGCSVLAACSSGPSEGEYVKACLASSSPQMGVNEKMCSCMAHESRANLPATYYRAMVLNMQGKKQESEAILGDLPFDKRADFGMKQFEILGKCMHGQ
jgi:hypothetical protein